MMTSDSDESDYEDARQHHDNQPDDVVEVGQLMSRNIFIPTTHSALSISSPSNSLASQNSERGNERGERNSALEFQHVTSRRHPDSLINIDAADALANREEAPPEVIEEEPPVRVNDVFPNDYINEQDVIGDVQRVLIRFQGYFQDNAGQAVVDSDDDDVDTISDDSEMDFPMLDRERDRAVSSDENEAQDTEVGVHLQEFDQELPIRHSYLGEGMEALQGRIVLEEDATLEIPLISMGIHLTPGQTLPLTIFHAVFQNAIRRCVMNDRLFGIVHNEMDMPTSNVVYKGALGTLAEIYEYQEESDGDVPRSMSSSFALKAKGRQRFNVLEVRRQADGNLMGRVRIRPEIRLNPFILNILLPGTSRCFLSKKQEDMEADEKSSESTVPQHQVRTSSISQSSRACFRRDSVISTVSNFGSSDKELLALKSKIQAQRKRLKYYSVMTPQPYFVFEHYDETILVEKVHRLLKTELKGLAESGGKIPLDASDLSFWLAQNLTMDDTHRTKILKMDSSIQRLRYELDLLARTTKVIGCRNCQTNIADHSQIFSMSIEGPQGTYVNPHGFVHETLTVYKAKELLTRGLPSTESSWFPGYSWTIVECKRCKTHIGWKFQAVGRLKPTRFWGLARRSVIFKYDFGSDSDLQETLDNDRTPPNSANSEAFAAVSLF